LCVKCKVADAQKEFGRDSQEARATWNRVEPAKIQSSMASFVPETFYPYAGQALTFLNCYSVARIFGSKRYYDGDMYEKANEWVVVIYLISFVLNGFIFLPRTLPWATILFCIPPEMDAGDLERLQDVLEHRPDGITEAVATKLLERRSKAYLEGNAGLKSFVTATDDNGDQLRKVGSNATSHLVKRTGSSLSRMALGTSAAPELHMEEGDAKPGAAIPMTQTEEEKIIE